jgi:hypothetical protein
MIIQRLIPPEVLGKLGTEYVQSGGTIRVAPGFDKAGSIIKHLRFPEDSQTSKNVLEQLKATAQQNQQALGNINNMAVRNKSLLNGIQSLQNATLALQGMNLAVSAVGFVVIINKLNKISQQLEQIDAKLDTLQLTANEIRTYQELTHFAKYTANLENLSSGLRLENSNMIDGAISNLRESQHMFQSVCDKQLLNLKNVYNNSDSFQIHFQGALGSVMCIANAHAQQGELVEAKRVINGAKNWQTRISDMVCQPIETQVKPVWLGRLDHKKRTKARLLINTQKAIPESLLYLKDTYNICEMKGLELHKQGADKLNNLLVIDP